MEEVKEVDIVKECYSCRDCYTDSEYKINPEIPKNWVDSKEVGLLCGDCYVKRQNKNKS